MYHVFNLRTFHISHYQKLISKATSNQISQTKLSSLRQYLISSCIHDGTSQIWIIQLQMQYSTNIDTFEDYYVDDWILCILRALNMWNCLSYSRKLYVIKMSSCYPGLILTKLNKKWQNENVCHRFSAPSSSINTIPYFSTLMLSSQKREYG